MQNNGSSRTEVILWSRLDTLGCDSAKLFMAEGMWHIQGSALFLSEGQPCKLDYEVVCDTFWYTCSVKINGWVGKEEIQIEIRVDPLFRWTFNGVLCDGVTGCVDIDLSFSPVTNMLPIKRLKLSDGQSREVTAAWLRFPELDLVPLDQNYKRINAGKYRYEAIEDHFITELTLDDTGFVTDYPDLWKCEGRL
jgi:hypothetical protein